MAKKREPGEIEVRPGRRATPFTNAHDWVGLADIVQPPAHSLYVKLKMHVNQEREREGDTEVWPTRYTLAEMMDYGKVDTLDRYIDQLEQVGAIDVDRRGMPARCYYTLNDLPADAYCAESRWPIAADERCKQHPGSDNPCEVDSYCEESGLPIAEGRCERHLDAAKPCLARRHLVLITAS
jgi:hypothetical protein